METVFNYHNIFLIAHIFGVAIGAGGAFAGDILFFSSIKDKHISRTESRFVGVTSKMIWFGILILLISGVGLVWLKPETFLFSGKFWAKMTVVGVIIANGIVFHFRHIPMLRRSYIEEFSEAHELVKNRIWILISGAVSVVSWSYAIVLGVLRKTPFGYVDFISVYLLLLLIAVSVALLLRKKIIPSK